MKTMTMCILILMLAGIVPIADTQTTPMKKFMITLNYQPNKSTEGENILRLIVGKTVIKMNNNNTIANISTNIKSDWDRGIILTFFPACKEVDSFILEKHVRLKNKFLHPEVQETFRNTPAVLLYTPNSILVKWDKGNKGLIEAIDKVSEEASKYFLGAYKH